MILAIDDDPGRYDGLRVLLNDRIELKIASCKDCIAEFITKADAILLDHDLCSQECTCGEWPDIETTREYVNWINNLNIPTIVTSCSNYDNREWLIANLKVPKRRHSAMEIQPEYHWIGWLWSQNVLK